MTDKEKFEEEALAEFLHQTGIPKERVDKYGKIHRVEFQAYGETYELKNPGLIVIFKTFSDGFLPVLYFPKKHQDCSEIPTGSTTKNCRTCRNQGSHNGICDICKKYSCWTEIEPTTKNDLEVDINILALLEKTYEDFYKCEGGEGWLKIDGKEYSTDAGYAIEGVDIFMEVFKRRLAELPSVTPQEPFLNKPCVSSGVCEHDKNKVLDKIRAEIFEISSYHGFELGGVKDGYRIAMVNVLNIIDKYKSESED